jgi:hypothetical protein
MAKVQNNVIVRGMTGLFGDQLVLKQDKAGRTILSNRPHFDENRVFTPAQRAQQERFRAARAYAREAKNLEVYQAKAAGTPQTPSNVPMTDWFHPPADKYYYPAGGAMRSNSDRYYLLKDHLGSASVVTNAAGTIVGESRYYPFGETRFTTGTMFVDKLFTGQREMAGLGIDHPFRT